MIGNIPAAFLYQTDSFRYTCKDDKEAHCGLNVFVREDMSTSDYWAVIEATQHPEEHPALAEDADFLFSQVLDRVLFANGIQAIPLQKYIFLENYEPTRAVRYGRMERVHFRRSLLDLFGFTWPLDPAWYTTRPGVIENLMGYSWEQMHLREIKRYVG